MTYILTFISGLATLCLLLAIPYVIGTIAGRYADREGNSTVEEKLLIGLLLLLGASIIFFSVYILGMAVMDFLTK
mgnify:CR=1 FL=1